MTLFEYIGISVLLIYTITILLFALGWFKIKPHYNTSSNNAIPVSVIIACRNEEVNISTLLCSLINQKYPKDNFEIIIVDDHSNDTTASIIEEYITSSNNHIKLIKLSDENSSNKGKKAAIALGIKASQHDVIVTTDADCIMNSYWLSTLINYYISYKPKMIIGPVTFHRSKKIFEYFQTLEFLSLIGSGAGASGIHRPIMCNGANLLFEKSLYNESTMQMNQPSGDDIFLMLHTKKTFKKGIHFIKSKHAIVKTSAPKKLIDFFHQRSRWTSKSKFYTDTDIILTALVVAFANLLIVCNLIASAFDISHFSHFIALLIIKSIADLVLLIPITKFFQQRYLLWTFPLLQLIYPFYIVITITWSLFGNFRWKNRKYH